MAWLFNKETAESWQSDDVKKWKESSSKLLKSFFIQYRGTQYDEYDIESSEIYHLRFRILFALFGLPKIESDKISNRYEDYTDNINIGYSLTFINLDKSIERPFNNCLYEADSMANNNFNNNNKYINDMSFRYVKPITDNLPFEFLNSYTLNQRDIANNILQQLLKIHIYKRGKKAYIGTIFISCKEDNLEYILPIFYILENGENPLSPLAKRLFIDKNARVYNDWKTWRFENKLPAVKYAIPANGFFTTGKGFVYDFNPEGQLDLIYENSPSCNTSTQILKTLDNVSTIGGLTCGVIASVAMVTPVAPLLLASSVWIGAGFAGYSGIRGGYRIYDKNIHKETLIDIESGLMILTIITAPLSFVGPFDNFLIQAGKLQSLIPSESLNMFTAIVNMSNLGLDGLLICYGIASLIDKSKHDILNAQEVLHFSMTMFFYSGTLIEPKLIEIIIIQGEDERLQKVVNNVENDVQANLDKFVSKNRSSGEISERSRLIRTMNKIDHVTQIFGPLWDNIKMMELYDNSKEFIFILHEHKSKINNFIKNFINFKNNDKTPEKSQRSCNITINEPINDKTIYSNYFLFKKPYKRISNIRNDICGNQIRDFYNCSNLLEKLSKGNEYLMNLSQLIIKMFKLDKMNIINLIQIISFILDEAKKRNTTSVKDGLKSIWKDFDNFQMNILNDYKFAADITRNQNIHFHDKFKLLLLYRRYKHSLIEHLQNDTIYIYIETLPKLYDNSYIPDSIQIAEVEYNIHRHVVCNRLGRDVAILKNFLPKKSSVTTDKTCTSNGNNNNNNHNIKTSLPIGLFDIGLLPKVKDILWNIPRLICYNRGYTTTNTNFYLNIPVEARFDINSTNQTQ